jgi:hypothetical protein
MIARRLGVSLGTLRLAGYLAARGTPQTLEDLAQHNCLHYSFLPGSPGTLSPVKVNR